MALQSEVNYEDMTDAELNVAVGTKVMGESLDVPKGYKGVEMIWSDGRETIVPKPYSTDMNYAWEIIEKLQGEWSWEMKMHNLAKEVEVRIGKGSAVNVNVPRAICIAALKAME